MGKIIIGIFIIVLAVALLMIESDIDFIKGILCCAIISIILYIGASYLYTTFTLKEFTVYQNGNIELEGKNYFGDNDIHRFSFSECNVVKGSSNTYSCFESKIKLNSEYYEQYKATLKDEKSVTIEIKK